MTFLCTQGMLKARKRVTLMVVTVSVIAVISWGSDAILHLFEQHIGSIKLSPFAITTVHTVIMFNSAVNPFAYALISQRFREKLKEMICCSPSSFITMSYVIQARRAQNIKMAPNTQQNVATSQLQNINAL